MPAELADIEAYLRSKATEYGVLRALEALEMTGCPLSDRVREIHRSSTNEALRELQTSIRAYESAHGIIEPERVLPLAVRRAWFEDYIRRAAEGKVTPPPLGPRHACACCGYPTLSGQRGENDVCSLCSWQDDGQDDPESDQIHEGPNQGYSLTEARTNFEHYLGMYGPDPERGARVAGDESPAEMESKRMLVAAFHAIQRGAPDPLVRTLWDWIYRCERVLTDEWRAALGEGDESTGTGAAQSGWQEVDTIKERRSVINVDREMQRLIRDERLDDMEYLLTPREFDEVPFVSRIHRIDFLSQVNVEEQSRILLVNAVRHLDRILTYVASAHRTDVVVMISMLHWDDLSSAEPYPVIPNFWICTNPARDLAIFRLCPGASDEASLIRNWLESDGLLESHEVFENAEPATDQTLRRVYVAQRECPRVRPFVT